MAEYLERESILNAIRKNSDFYVDQQGLYLSCELIAAMPAVDVQPVKRGKWIGVDYDTYFECSECKHMTDWQLYKYCPYCGARMDGDTN